MYPFRIVKINLNIFNKHKSVRGSTVIIEGFLINSWTGLFRKSGSFRMSRSYAGFRLSCLCTFEPGSG